MQKLLLGTIAGLLGMTAASVASAQSQAILKSPSIAKARACLDQLIAAGKKAEFYTDREGGHALVLNPTQRPLHPLLVQTQACFAAAHPKRAIVTNPNTGVKSLVWYVYVEGYYSWCATNSLTNKIESIEVLGGYGPRRDWYSVAVSCAIDEKILGFYAPQS